MTPEVLCIGQAVIDCITRGRENDPIKKNVYRAQSVGLNTGGDAVNESTILSRLDHKVAVCGGVGDDVAGRLILSELEKEGVDTSLITIDPTISTPVANLMVGTDGSRSSINCDATMLGDFVVDPACIPPVKVVTFASLFRAPLDRPEVVIALAKKAKEMGAILCADTKIANYRKIDLADIKEILPLIDYFFPNEVEAGNYTGETEYKKMAERIQSYGVKNVIIKTGPDGCYVAGEKESFAMPAMKVDAVDSTGAGDNFVAGFIDGLLRGKSLYECCQFGTACAAVSVQAVGATSGVKGRNDVEQMLND